MTSRTRAGARAGTSATHNSKRRAGASHEDAYPPRAEVDPLCAGAIERAALTSLTDAVTGALLVLASQAALGCTPAAALVDTRATAASVGSGSPASCNEAALRRALAANAVVTFDCGSAPVVLPITETIALRADRDTVIDGGDLVTLDGGRRARIFSLARPGYRDNPFGLTLQRIRLVNGQAPGSGYVERDPSRPWCAWGYKEGGGGAIEVRNARLRLIGVELSGNAGATPGPDIGGALYAVGSTGIAIVGSVFSANSGANGGAVGLLQSNARIHSSRFVANRANGTGANNLNAETAACPGVGHPGQGGAGGNGGAIAIDGSDDTELAVCASEFIDNSANELAGALFRVANVAARPTALERSVFLRNRARIGGAAFVMNASLLSVATSSFIDNAAEGGGAMLLVNSSFEIGASLFAGNQATRGVGGALLLSGSGPASVIRDSTFARNTAAASNERHGGAFFGAMNVGVERSFSCDLEPAVPAGAALPPVTREGSGRCTVTPIAP